MMNGSHTFDQGMDDALTGFFRVYDDELVVLRNFLSRFRHKAESLARKPACGVDRERFHSFIDRFQALASAFLEKRIGAARRVILESRRSDYSEDLEQLSTRALTACSIREAQVRQLKRDADALMVELGLVASSSN